MSEIPELTLDKAVAALGHRDEYKFILDSIREQRECLIKEFGPSETADKAMHTAGRIAGVDELLDLLTPQE